MRHEVLALDITGATLGDGHACTGQRIKDLRNACVYIHQAVGGDAFSFKVQVKIASDPAPTTVKAAADVVAPADPDDDWIDLDVGPIVAPKLVPLVLLNMPLPITHVRLFRTSVAVGIHPPKALVAGYNARTT